MPSWNFNQASDTFYYFGKVIRSYAGPASEEYIKASGDRARGTMMWHLEIEPQSFKYASAKEGEGNGRRNRSTNLPAPGMAPRKTSALMGRIEAFKQCGFEINNEEDFGIVEGHIFYFADEKRKFDKFEKQDDWPTVLADNYEPPADLPVIGTKDGGGSGGGDPWSDVATLMDGFVVGSSPELKIVMGSGNPNIQGNVEIMTLVQQNKLAETLVEKGKGTIDSKTKTFTANK